MNVQVADRDGLERCRAGLAYILDRWRAWEGVKDPARMLLGGCMGERGRPDGLRTTLVLFGPQIGVVEPACQVEFSVG